MKFILVFVIFLFSFQILFQCFAFFFFIMCLISSVFASVETTPAAPINI